MASPQELLTALARAYALTDTLPSGDTTLHEALEAVRDLHEAAGWVVIRLEGEGFMVNGKSVLWADDALLGFNKALADASLSEIRLQEPGDPHDLEDFLRRLNPALAEPGVPGLVRFQGLEGVVGLSFSQTGGGVPGMAGSIQALFGGGEGSAEAEPVSKVDAAEESVFEAEEDSEVGRLLASYFSTTGQEQSQAGEAITAACARMAEARDFSSIADLVEGLCDGSNVGRKDWRALELATRLTSTNVASQIVGRLGSNRDEEERVRLINTSAGLGREMALALADALGEARDRFQRRAFMDAMVAHGEVAREMAETMVADPRWYVVRNGVSLLGELGGEGTVTHLTSTLANPDTRVRRETVVALAKLGGDDAAMLLLGMLGDSEPDIRARACTAVGVLKVDRALKPLMTLLQDDRDLDVQIQSLNALGQIGDPGAVPLIEKKAVKRLFSRPPTEVRLAAYRALAGIGTPHAMQLLNKATKDSDRAVRKLAKGLVD